LQDIFIFCIILLIVDVAKVMEGFIMSKVLTALGLLLMLSLVEVGCGSKPELPGRKPGSLLVQFSMAESRAVAKDVRLIVASLKLRGGSLSLESEAKYDGAGTTIYFPKVYPGTWAVILHGFDQDNDIIFHGEAETEVEPGESGTVLVNLKPATANLDISFNASEIPEIGESITKGRLAIYLDPSSNSATYKDLILEGTQFKAIIPNLPQGSYSARICIPNASSPVYTSPYFIINLYSGKTTTINIDGQGDLNVSAIIDSIPETPAGFGVNYQSETAKLSWQPTNDSDLNCYRIYRTNPEGRLCLLAEVDPNETFYSDPISKDNGHIVTVSYAVSCLDSGGLESQLSQIISIQLE
jgi:hypothetical protein